MGGASHHHVTYCVDFGDSSRALSELFADNLKDKKKVSVDINECYKPDIVSDICDLHMFKNGSVDGWVLTTSQCMS